MRRVVLFVVSVFTWLLSVFTLHLFFMVPLFCFCFCWDEPPVVCRWKLECRVGQLSVPQEWCHADPGIFWFINIYTRIWNAETNQGAVDIFRRNQPSFGRCQTREYGRFSVLNIPSIELCECRGWNLIKNISYLIINLEGRFITTINFSRPYVVVDVLYWRSLGANIADWNAWNSAVEGATVVAIIATAAAVVVAARAVTSDWIVWSRAVECAVVVVALSVVLK